MSYNAGSSGHSLPTFQDNLWTLEMGLTGCSETKYEITTTRCVIAQKSAALACLWIRKIQKDSST